MTQTRLLRPELNQVCGISEAQSEPIDALQGRFVHSVKSMLGFFQGLIPSSFQPSFLSIKQPFSLGFWRFSRKKDPWKEWGRYPWNTTALTALFDLVQLLKFSVPWG